MTELDPFWSSRADAHDKRQPSFKMSTEQFGMLLLFASLTVIFVASIVAYLITRAQNDYWLDPNGSLPSGLWLSTVLMLATSVMMQRSLGHIRANRVEALVRGLRWAAGIAVVFLVCQTLNWVQVREAQRLAARPSLYAFTFYMLTGLHALHVLGGLLPLGLILARATGRQYSSSRHAGVTFCVQYWHFLGAVWLVLLATMYVST